MNGNQNECECPNPPGGRLVCEAGQLAICRVKDGEIQPKCVNPPSQFRRTDRLTVSDKTAFYNWALSQITGQPRPSTESLGYQDLKILETGFYHDETRGIEVTFRLPRPFEDDFVVAGERQGGGAAPAAEAVS